MLTGIGGMRTKLDGVSGPALRPMVLATATGPTMVVLDAAVGAEAGEDDAGESSASNPTDAVEFGSFFSSESPLSRSMAADTAGISSMLSSALIRLGSAWGAMPTPESLLV